MARIAHLHSQIEWQEGVATGLAYANASLQQRLAPPLSCRVSARARRLGIGLQAASSAHVRLQGDG